MSTKPIAWDEFSSDGEEIVYLESVFASPAAVSEADESDYVLIPHLRSPPFRAIAAPRSDVQRNIDTELSGALSTLSLASTKNLPESKPKPSTLTKPDTTTPAIPKHNKPRRSKPSPKKNVPAQSPPDSAYPSPPASPAPQSRRVRKRAASKSAKLGTGLGSRTIVDDVSQLDDGDAENPALAAARSYIASHLANPPAKLNSGMLLPLLQALIVELDLSEQTPRSLNAAKGILKSRAFIGVREYLAAREAGQEAIQRAMHPSRTSLVRALRKGSSARVPREWVKSTGLSVLLVNTRW
ncbi:hypothetical protein K488DRAFT_72647 [Vararia minispora EC-137]|uniref:Uncharacterized protein n=1 Tax=Vararia minispora EC-137 TaxID=1314806 RepID=A0ACB8QDZ6_9AGAM|nr:hypothetical protein K488DRAFT_72647 [Vararia minispora EC-137]